MAAPEPATGATALVLNRAFVRLRRLEQWFEGLRRQSAEREDVAPLGEVLRAIHVWIVEVQRQLVDEARNLPKELSPEDADDLETTYAKWLELAENNVSSLVPLIGRAHGPDFAPLVLPLSRLARLIVPGSALVFQATEAWEYSRKSRLHEILERNTSSVLTNPDLARMINELRRISVISYPVINESDVFQQLMIGHEFGHLALRKPSDRAAVTLGDAIFQSATQATEAPTNVADVDAPQRLARPWFMEIACDVVALRVVGPAYLLALWEFARPHNVWIYPSEWQQMYRAYPALAWRLRTLEDHIKAYLTPDDQTEGEPWLAIASVFELVADSVPELSAPRDASEEYARRLVAEALRQLEERLDGILTRGIYEPNRFHADVPVIWKKLNARIAPAERVLHRTGPDESQREPWQTGMRWSKPIDWRSIINVSYLYWLATHRSDAAPTYRERALDEDAERRAFAAHVYGSIELSELQRQMETLKRELRELDRESVASERRNART